LTNFFEIDGAKKRGRDRNPASL